MSCREHRRNLVEFARGGPLDSHERHALAAHLEGCPECTEALDQQVALTSAVRDLAGEAALAVPPADLEAALLAELDSAGRRRPLRAAVPWVPAMIGALAAMILAGWFLAGPRAPAKHPSKVTGPALAEQPPIKGPLAPVVQADARTTGPDRIHVPRRKKLPVRAAASPLTGGGPTATKPQPDDESAPFIAIPYTEPLAPYERASIVRMDLPLAAVAAAGLPVRIADPFVSARADVLVGQDGRVRAIRLLRISALN